MPISTLITLVLIGLTAGFLSGMIGIGGGIIIVPALIYFLQLDQHTAQGTSIALMLPPIGILAAMNYYNQGKLDISYAVVIAIAFIAGGFVGSKASLMIENQLLLKRIFGGILLLVGVKMIFFSK